MLCRVLCGYVGGAPEVRRDRAGERWDGGGLEVWLFGGCDWYVRDRHGLHVDHAVRSLGFEPNVFPSFDALPGEIVKVVGYCADTDRVERCLRRV